LKPLPLATPDYGVIVISHDNCSETSLILHTVNGCVIPPSKDLDTDAITVGAGAQGALYIIVDSLLRAYNQELT